MTHGNFNVYRESRDRRVREEAFEKYFGEFKYLNTFAAMYSRSVKFDTTLPMFATTTMRVRQPCSVVTCLCPSMSSLSRRFLRTKPCAAISIQRVLGLPEIDMFDLYTPIVEDVDFKVT